MNKLLSLCALFSAFCEPIPLLCRPPPLSKSALISQTADQIETTMRECRELFYAQQRRLQDILAARKIAPLMGRVVGARVPAQFEFHMSGIALIASYRAEKKKLENFFVCLKLESFSEKLKSIAQNVGDGRFAFIVPISGDRSTWPRNYPQHKVAIGVEKRGRMLQIALLDPQADLLAEGVDRARVLGKQFWEKPFGKYELSLRAVRDAAKFCTVEVFVSAVEREFAGGCAVFALEDAESFLLDKNFFSRIRVHESVQRITSTLSWKTICALPPEYMVGVQSATRLARYKEQYPDFARAFFVSKSAKKNLNQYLSKYMVRQGSEGRQKEFNQYILWRLYRYTHMVNSLLAAESIEMIQERIDQHLL